MSNELLNKQLLDAVLNDDQEQVKSLLNEGADVNAKDDDGQTPLHCARSAKIAKVLIKNGADVNAVNNDGITPLHCTYNYGIAKALIENGANIYPTHPLIYQDRNIYIDPDDEKSLTQFGLKVHTIDEKGNKTDPYVSYFDLSKTYIELAKIYTKEDVPFLHDNFDTNKYKTYNLVESYRKKYKIELNKKLTAKKMEITARLAKRTDDDKISGTVIANKIAERKIAGDGLFRSTQTPLRGKIYANIIKTRMSKTM